MNNKSLKRILSIALIALMAVFALSFVACDNGGEPSVIGGNTVTEIYIEKSKMPRQLYVQGQELDLTGGVLTTVIDGAESPMPLTAEGITVSGYDKNTVGNQTVTVTYKEKTTTFPVTVIAPAVAENYEATYFVGDVFNKTKGKLRLAKDNGDTFVVNMSDPAVVVTSFDSSKEGEKSVSVSYTKDGKTYNCSFNVTFYAPSEIKFVAPKKTSYSSTDAQLNLSGGYLTVKAAAPAKLSKSVTLTQDMVSGYNPGALTLDNRYEPVTQVITVSYAGQTWTFNVSVTFSGRSVIEELAKQFSDLTWGGTDLPTLTEEQMYAAVDAMEVYLGLAPAEQELISEETLTSIVRAATVGAEELYAIELNSLADAFMLNFSTGSLAILGKTYEVIENAAERLSDPNDGFNRYSAILRAIKSGYASVQLTSTLLVSNYVVTHAEAANETIVPMLEHMLNVYDTMKGIPEDWDLETLEAYSGKILDTVSMILLSEYKGYNYMALYNPITNWRADFFEIIYTYYYEIKEGGKEDIQTKLWGVVPAPGLVYTWYTTFMNAYNEAYNIYANAESGKSVLYDTSKFFYYYTTTVKLANQIKSEGTPMDKGIYELLSGDVLIESYLRRGSSGYLAIMGLALNDSDVVDVWEAYLPIYEKYLSVANQEQYTAFLADNKADMQVLFSMLADLTPAQFHSFLSSLNYLYDNTGGALPLFNYSQNGATSVFVACVVSTCMSSTPESTRAMLQNLFLAVEYYSLRNNSKKAIEYFIMAMDAVMAAEGVSAEDKDAFFAAYGMQTLFDKYKAIYDAVKDQTKIETDSDLAAKLEELNSWMDKYDEMLSVIVNTDTSTDEGMMRVNMAYPLMFAIYDKIEQLRNEIMQTEEGVFALTAKEYSVLSDGEDVIFTLDTRYYSVKSITVNLMLSNAMGKDLVWDIHNVDGLAELFTKIVDVMYAEFNGKAYDGNIYDIIAIFKNTTPETKYAFFQLQGTQMLYGAIERYMRSVLPAELVETGIVRYMLDADIYYWVYQYDKENLEALATFRANLEAVSMALIGNEYADVFAEIMGDMYDFLEGEYDNLKDVVIPEAPEEEPEE